MHNTSIVVPSLTVTMKSAAYLLLASSPGRLRGRRRKGLVHTLCIMRQFFRKNVRKNLCVLTLVYGYSCAPCCYYGGIRNGPYAYKIRNDLLMFALALVLNVRLLCLDSFVDRLWRSSLSSLENLTRNSNHLSLPKELRSKGKYTRSPKILSVMEYAQTVYTSPILLLPLKGLGDKANLLYIIMSCVYV